MFAELAKRALVATLDDGASLRAADGDPRLRVEVVASTDAIRLSIDMDSPDAVTLRLEPTRVDGNEWRDAWALELLRSSSNESWFLVPGGEPARIPDPRRSPLIVELRLKRFAIVRGGEYDPVPLIDVAFHRHTQQSSAAGDRAGPLSFAPATKREPSPWWEIDLSKPLFLSRMRFRFVANSIAKGAKVTVTAHTFPTKHGTAPPGSFSRAFDVDALPLHGLDRCAEVTDVSPVAGRIVRVAIDGGDGESVLEITSAEILAADPFMGTLASSIRQAFAIHADRPLFLDSHRYEPLLTYGDVWLRSRALGRALARRLGAGPRRVMMAVVLENRPEWIMCDLIAIDRGWTIAPLAPDDPEERLASILGRLRPDVLICGSRHERFEELLGERCLVVTVEDWPTLIDEGQALRAGEEPAAREGPEDERERIYTILFTSGSTGTPKGAMRSPATFYAMLESYGLSQRPRHLSFQPLSHLSERMIMPWLLIAGAEVAFSRGGEHLTKELKEYGPTELGAVPRLFDVLYAQYKRRLRSLVKADPAAPLAMHEQTALAEARGAFGPRLRAISVGSAPVSPEVLAFLKRCFDDLWVTEGYGSTEVGTIALDNKIVAGVDVKLLPLPDAAREEGAPERGEIWVKSAHVIRGYLGDDGEAKPVVDADGYFPTGDLGERVTDGSVKVIGRLKNTVKLAQGEFVSAERIETVLATTPGVDRIYVHVESGATGVSALVFAHDEAVTEPLLLSSLRVHGRRAGLPAWELPQNVLVEREAPTVDNGLLTTSGKLARATIAERFGSRLRLLPDAGESAPPTSAPEDGDDLDANLAARIVKIASRAIGRELDPDAPLDAAGVDSLATAEILAAIGEELGREIPLALWFEVSSIADLATRVLSFSARGTAAKAALIASDRQPRATPVVTTPTEAPPRTILLTGATGLLGAHLVEALLTTNRDAEIVCLVRGEDDAAAEGRLRDALARFHVSDLDDRRVRVLASDLTRPNLGLSHEAHDRLKREVDVVLHSAAEVSWLASYERLRGPNVHGTLALLALGRPFHFVSTISTAPADGDEWTTLSFEQAAQGSPYGLTKWIAEEHVRRAETTRAIYRPAMIAAHSKRGVGNPDDYVHRYLAGVAALGLYIDREDARLDMTPVDFVAEGIAKLLFANPHTGVGTIHFVNVDQSMTYAALGRAIKAVGFDVKPASYETFRQALLADRTSPLHPLAAYFPASGFTMAMGPWPCERSKKALREVGVSAPVIDEANIGRVMRHLAKHVIRDNVRL